MYINGGIPKSRNFTSRKVDRVSYGIETVLHERWSNSERFFPDSLYKGGALWLGTTSDPPEPKNSIEPLFIIDTTYITDTTVIPNVIVREIDTSAFFSFPGLHIYIGNQEGLDDNFAPNNPDITHPTVEEKRLKAYTSNNTMTELPGMDQLGQIGFGLNFFLGRSDSRLDIEANGTYPPQNYYPTIDDWDNVIDDGHINSFNSQNYLAAYSNMRNNPGSAFNSVGKMDVGCHLKDIGVVQPHLSNPYSTYDNNWESLESNFADDLSNPTYGGLDVCQQTFIAVGDHNSTMSFLPLFYDEAYHTSKLENEPIGSDCKEFIGYTNQIPNQSFGSSAFPTVKYGDYEYMRRLDYSDRLWKLKDHDELYGEKHEYGSTDFPAFNIEKWNRWMIVYCVAQSLGARYFTTFDNPNTILSPLARNYNYDESNYDIWNGTPRVSTDLETSNYEEDYTSYMDYWFDQLWNQDLSNENLNYAVNSALDQNGDGVVNSTDLVIGAIIFGGSLLISYQVQKLKQTKFKSKYGQTKYVTKGNIVHGGTPKGVPSTKIRVGKCGGKSTLLYQAMGFIGISIPLEFVLPVSRFILRFIEDGNDAEWNLNGICADHDWPSPYGTKEYKIGRNDYGNPDGGCQTDYSDCITGNYTGRNEYNIKYNYLDLKLSPNFSTSPDMISWNKGFDQLTGDLLRLNLTGYHVSGRWPHSRARNPSVSNLPDACNGNPNCASKNRFYYGLFGVTDFLLAPAIWSYQTMNNQTRNIGNRYPFYGYSNPYAKIKIPTIDYIWGDTIRAETDNLQRRKVWLSSFNRQNIPTQNVVGNFNYYNNNNFFNTPEYRTYADSTMQFRWSWTNSNGSVTNLTPIKRRFAPIETDGVELPAAHKLVRSYAKIAAPEYIQILSNGRRDSLFNIYPLRLSMTNKNGCNSNLATKWIKVHPRKLTPFTENFNNWYSVSGFRALKGWDFISPWSSGDGEKENIYFPNVPSQRGFFLRSSVASEKKMSAGTGWGSSEDYGSSNSRNWTALVYQPISTDGEYQWRELQNPRIYTSNLNPLIVPLSLSAQYEYPRRHVDQCHGCMNRRGASPYKNWYSKRGFYESFRNYMKDGAWPYPQNCAIPQPINWKGRNYRTHCFYDFWRHGMSDTARSPIYTNDSRENNKLIFQFDISNFYASEAKFKWPKGVECAYSDPYASLPECLEQWYTIKMENSKRNADTLKVYASFGLNSKNKILIYKKGGKDLSTTYANYNPTTGFTQEKIGSCLNDDCIDDISGTNFSGGQYYYKTNVTHIPKRIFDPNEWRTEIIDLNQYDTSRTIQFDFIYKNKHSRYIKHPSSNPYISDAQALLEDYSVKNERLKNFDEKHNFGLSYIIDQYNVTWEKFGEYKTGFYGKPDYVNIAPPIVDETMSGHSPLYITNMKLTSRVYKKLGGDTTTKITFDSTITKCDRKAVYTLKISAGHNAKKYQILLQTRPITIGSTNVWTNQVVIKEGNINNTWNSGQEEYQPNSEVIIRDSIQNMFGTVTGLFTGYEYAIRAKIINTSNDVYTIPADTFRVGPSITTLTCEPFSMQQTVLYVDSIKDTNKNYKVTAKFPSGHNVSTFQLFERKDPSTTWIPISSVLTIPNNNYYEYPFPNIVGKPDGNYFYYMELKNPSINCIPNSAKSNTRSVFACFGCKAIKKPTLSEEPIGSEPDANGNFAIKILLERNHNLKKLELYESRILTLNPYNSTQLGRKIATYTLSNNLEFTAIRNFTNKSPGFYYYTVKGIDAQNNQSNIVYSDFLRRYVPETAAPYCGPYNESASSQLSENSTKHYLEFYLNKNCSNNKYRVIMYRLDSKTINGTVYSASDENLSLNNVPFLNKSAPFEKFNPLITEIPTSTISFTTSELTPTTINTFTPPIEAAGYFNREISPKLTKLNNWYRIDIICTGCTFNNVKTFYKYFKSNINEN
jgi:hypothetical protein